MPTQAKSASRKVFVAKVTTGERVTIPKEIRRLLGVQPGDHLRFEPQDGEFRVFRERKPRSLHNAIHKDVR